MQNYRYFNSSDEFCLSCIFVIDAVVKQLVRRSFLKYDYCFFPGNRVGKFGVFELPVSREIYMGIPAILFTLARISEVLISIIPTKKKMRYCKFKKFILFIKNHFSKFAKFLRQNA